MTYVSLVIFQGPYQGMSPNHDLMSSSLPPMSTFRGPGQPPGTPGYQSNSPTVNGGEMAGGPGGGSAPPPSGQGNSGNTSAPPGGGSGPAAGSGSQSDALGNALKSVSTCTRQS